MGWSSTIALFFSLVALALLPSLSVMTVLARSASLGFFHGAITSLGIVLGDIFYILLAIYGLTFLADRLGPLAMGIQVVGAFYLIILGLLLWCSPAQVSDSDQPKLAMNRSWLSSFFAGFLLTLGDQKAIFFYLSFFPAFVDLSVLSPLDAGGDCGDRNCRSGRGQAGLCLGRGSGAIAPVSLGPNDQLGCGFGVDCCGHRGFEASFNGCSGMSDPRRQMAIWPMKMALRGTAKA